MLFKGSIEEAWNRLNECKFSETYYKIVEYKLFIKIFFEKKELKLLKSRLEAFLKYIKRQKTLSDERKMKNLNFIRAMNLIMSKQKTISFQRKDYLVGDYLWLEQVREK